MLGLTDLTVTEEYSALQILTQAQLHDAMVSVNQWTTLNNLQIAQLAQDVFGSSYLFNGDGLQTLTTPLNQLMAQLALDNTFEGSNTFNGTVAFEEPVISTSTFSSSGQCRVRTYRSITNQSLADSTATALLFAAESYDVGGMHDNAVNTSRITIPSGGAGLYKFHGQVRFAANGNGRREIYIYKNGVVIATFTSTSADAGFDSYLQVSCDDVSGPNDYYELFAFQSSGGALDVVFGAVNTFFSAMKVW